MIQGSSATESETRGVDFVSITHLHEVGSVLRHYTDVVPEHYLSFVKFYDVNAADYSLPALVNAMCSRDCVGAPGSNHITANTQPIRVTHQHVKAGGAEFRK